MRKSSLNNHRSIVIAVGLFISFLLLGFWTSLTKSDSPIYATEGNLFRECFKDPVERIIFVMKDGNFISYTTNHEYFIQISFGWFRHSLKKRGYKMSDVIYCIHNHHLRPFFSQKDKALFRYMRNDGFVGVFAIYHKPSKKVIIYED